MGYDDRFQCTSETGKPEVAYHYLDVVRQHSKVIDGTITKYGDLPLRQYLHGLDEHQIQGIQSRNDLVEVIHRYTGALLGESLAEKVSKGFMDNPVALTANHHGVDYFAQSVQGSLLFALRKLNGCESKAAVPIFSCGNIPLDNLTYPLGLLIYHTNGQGHQTVPMKLPVFSNSKRRALVSVSVPLSDDMVKRAKSRVVKMSAKHEITQGFAGTVQRMLDDCYASHDILDLSTYSEQSVILNHKIWNRLFVDPQKVPQAVTLELEEISRQLLVLDLKNPGSLAHSVLFDTPLTAAVIEKLDKSKAVWNQELLRTRLGKMRENTHQEVTSNGCGTMFFWGINNRGRRVPLYLDFDNQHNKMLRGIDDQGIHWELQFTEESIIEALNQKKLLPSIFTCFLVIAFARGVSCIGGYFQAEYLPDMQMGLVHALSEIKGYQKFADNIEQVVTHKYLSGMQTVMLEKKDRGLVPAGPLEIMSSGGLKDQDIEKILALTVKDAHIASLLETIADVARSEICDESWQRILANDCAQLVGESIVTKEMH